MHVKSTQKASNEKVMGGKQVHPSVKGKNTILEMHQILSSLALAIYD